MEDNHNISEEYKIRQDSPMDCRVSFKIFDDLLSGERSLPFGLLVDWIFFIFAGNKDNYKSLDEFEFGQNSTADSGVSCP